MGKIYILISVLVLFLSTSPALSETNLKKISVVVGANAGCGTHSGGFEAKILNKKIEVYFGHSPNKVNPIPHPIKVYGNKRIIEDWSGILCPEFPRRPPYNISLTGKKVDLYGRWKDEKTFEAYTITFYTTQDKIEVPTSFEDYGNTSAGQNNIRRIDFRNFTYHLEKTSCAKMLGRSIVQVRNGKFGDPTDVYFGVDTDGIAYGDLTGDGHDEAIIITYCGGMHPIEQAFVYTMKNGRVLLLTKLEEGDRAFGGIVRSHLCQGCSNGINIQSGLLTVERMWGNAACCPKYIEKKTYRWNGRRLVQVGRNQRKRFIERR